MRAALADRGGDPAVVARVRRVHGPAGAGGLRIEPVLEERDTKFAERRQPLGRNAITGEGLEPLAVLLHEPGADAVGADRLGDGAQEVAHHALHVEGRGHRAAGRQQRLGLGQLRPCLPRELGVLHGQAHLRGHALDQADLRRREDAPGPPPDEEQTAHGRAMGHGRHEQHRVLGKRAGPLAVEARIVQHVRAPRGAPGVPGLEQPGKPLEHDRAAHERIDEVLGDVVAGHGEQPLATRVEEIGAGHVGPEGACDLARHAAHDVAAGVGL